MNKLTPKDFFFHIASLVTLYVSSSSLIILLFQIINYVFPDALDNRYYSGGSYTTLLIWAIASLVVIFPLYIFFTYSINRDYTLNPEKREFGFRKWLTYLTLFLAGAFMIGDLIAVIYTYLGGEISTRFILKALSILIVTLFVFGYYLRDLRSVGAMSIKERILFRYGALFFVLVSVVIGFIYLGSPVSQRLLRFDSQKINDLQSIQWQLINYWQQKAVLPSSLEQLQDPISGFFVANDPQTSEDYEYRVISARTFELCANFNRPSSNNSFEPGITHPVRLGSEQNSWQHQVGRTCFERTIDPQLYPPIKNIDY